MQKIRLIRRSRIILGIMVIFSLYLCYYLINQSGSIKYANGAVDARIEEKKNQEERKSTIEGSILDRNGQYITVGEEAGKPAKLVSPQAYSALIGFNSPRYGQSGLRYTYRKELLYGGKDKKGAEITLTIDNALQHFCYSKLEEEGSIIILDHEGKILAMVSRSDSELEYNVNEIEQNWNRYSAKKNFFYNRGIFEQDCPGSTFKIVSAASMLENNMEDYTYDDCGNYEGVHNAGNVSLGNLDLTKALINSSNTYFASVADKLGGVKLKLTTDKFMFNKVVNLDFTSLNSQIDFGYYDAFTIQQTAFGQGRIQISPLHLVMIIGSVQNNGTMMKPYLIKSIEDDGKLKYKGKKESISDCMTKKNAQNLQTMLHEVALSYGINDTYGDVIAKTGTAQVSGSKDAYYHIYLLMATKNYSVVISHDKSVRSSGSLVKEGKEILKYLQTNEF